MPKFVPVPPEQAEKLKSKTSVDLTPYIKQIEGMKHGETAELIFETGENRRAELLRVRTAAKELGVDLRWRATSDPNRVFFTIYREG